MLIEQLKELIDYGFVEKKSFNSYPLHVEYSLTPDKAHMYEIHVFALDKLLNLQKGFLLNELYHEMDEHILEQYTLKGIYEN